MDEKSNTIEHIAPIVNLPEKLPNGWTTPRALELIHEIATSLYELPYILETFGLTKEQYDFLCENEWVKKAIEKERIRWNSADNTNERLSIESAIALERVIPDLTARSANPQEPLTGLVALAKLLAEMSGTVGNAKTQEAPREKFKIVINLGADQQTFEKAIPTINISSEDIKKLPNG